MAGPSSTSTVRTPAHGIAHALRASSALSSGVDAAAAAPPAGDAIIFAAVPQTIDSGYDAPTAYLTTGLETEDWSVRTEGWSGQPQLYLQMDTNKVKTWEEAQAEPSHDYTPLYQEEQPEGWTGTTVWSVLTSAQTERMEQAEAHTTTRGWTEANGTARMQSKDKRTATGLGALEGVRMSMPSLVFVQAAGPRWRLAGIRVQRGGAMSHGHGHTRAA